MGKERRPTDVRDPVISFRAGEETSRWLEEIGARHGLSRSELAKRLLLMSRHNLDARYLPSLLELAKELGEFDGFGQAVVVVYSAVHTEEARCPAQKGDWDEEKRHQVIMDTITVNIFLRRLSKGEEFARQKAEEEKKKIKISLPWTAY